MNALQALKNRDFDALEDAIESSEQALVFRNKVLPHQSPDDIRWFWQQIMTPEQLEQTFCLMRSTLTNIVSLNDLQPLHDLQGGYVDGFPVVYATDKAIEVIYANFEPERFAFLRAFLMPFPSD